FQMMRAHVFGRLLYTLPPVDIRIIQKRGPFGRAAGNFVEVRNVVWKRMNGGPPLPQREYRENGNTRAGERQPWNDAADPYENQRKYRKQITHANLIGGKRNEDHIK